MKNRIKKFIANILSDLQRGEVDRKVQILLSLQYKSIPIKKSSIPSFHEVEFSSYSQNNEDGILLLIFSVVGETNKVVIEICAGDGIECNAANLIINHGWKGLLFDGDAKAIKKGKEYYSKRNNAWRFNRLPPTLINAWITRDNVNELILEYGVKGELDLLSLDMDGVDYYIWESIHCISPRVVVCEYNNRWNADYSVTVPYSDNFIGIGANVDGEGYFGASLSALTKLAKSKGYRLVGANSPNTNAFFLRNGIGEEYFPEVSVESCLQSEYAIYQQKNKFPLIKDKPIINI